MHTPLSPTPLPVSSIDPHRVDADWLIVPIFEEEDPSSLPLPDAALTAQLRRAAGASGFTGKRFEFLHLAPDEPGAHPRSVVLLGAGPSGEYTSEIARRLASAAMIHARDRRVSAVAFLHRDPAGRSAQPESPAHPMVQAESEGLTLGEFAAGRYKTAEETPRRVAPVILVPNASAEALERLSAAAGRGRLLAHCANLARELVNEPGNLLWPQALAERAREIAAGTDLQVEVLDEKRLEALGMGLLLGVGQGSHRPPRLIVLTHAPQGAAQAPVLGLVGKGVTFDTGGISIKAAEGMERMKDDMAGGAAVLLALRAISLLGAPIRVVGIVPAVENMPGGGAIRPGDVLRGLNGRTVEVVNTDAEGRLILGDAVAYAERLGATHVVDIATLTGACLVALGKTTTGAFGRPDDWRERVRAVATRCGERTWAMPLFDDYRELLKSEIADTLNSAGRYAAAITAAMFIGDFLGHAPWVHLDIAGTAWNDEAKPYLPKGPTGVGVRTLVELAFEMARDAANPSAAEGAAG